jgi:hypothetical protein
MSDEQRLPRMKPTSYASPEEIQAYLKLVEMSKRSPIPDSEILNNLGLFQVRGSLARMLFMHTSMSGRLTRLSSLAFDGGKTWRCLRRSATFTNPTI